MAPPPLLKIGRHPDRHRILRQRRGLSTVQGKRMPDKPVTTYVVSVFEKPNWRKVLTTKDKDKALAMAKESGDKVRVETIAPKPKRR